MSHIALLATIYRDRNREKKWLSHLPKVIQLESGQSRNLNSSQKPLKPLLSLDKRIPSFRLVFAMWPWLVWYRLCSSDWTQILRW